jgi:enamine deaminase RidA (YjgF/YER057c/UK114 family)
METQVRAAFHNLEKQLKEAGGTLKDMVKTTTFFVNYQTAHLETFKQVRKEFLGEHQLPASTLVGVQALAAERLLVEIEAVAVFELK